MSATTEPEFYDVAMTGAGEPAMLPLETSPWQPLYRAAAAWIHLSHPVVDLGCGTGRFAEMLRRLEHHGGYLGIDFSPAAIAEARSYVGDDEDEDIHPEWACAFEVADLRSWAPDPQRPGSTMYVCLETLEHLADDVDLIRRIPPGHELIFSVPNYASAAHLRTFPDPSGAWHRYGQLLTFTAWTLIAASDREAIHLYRSRRRLEAW